MTRPVLRTALIEADTPRAHEVMGHFSLAEDQQDASKPEGILARALLRKMLSEETATAPAPWTFRRGQNGKPEALFNGAPSPFAISLSHSGPYIACAIAKADALGIDIEVHKDWRDLKNIAELAFGPEEQRMVAREGADAFYRIWTLREALAKATGQGLELAADGVDQFAMTVSADGGLAKLSSERTAEWQMGYRQPIAGLSAAIAIRSKAFPTWTWEVIIK